MPHTLLPHAFFTLPSGDRLRYAQLMPETPPRGTILIVPGRREFIEKKYAEVGENLLALGFRLVIVEPRGQGLSSRFLTAEKRQRDHVDDFDTHLNDLRAFYADIIRPLVNAQEPLIVHGHSLGGHVLLRWLAEDAPDVSKAFFTSPMLALGGMTTHIAAYGITWASVKLFCTMTDYAPMQHDFGAEDCVFAGNPLTQDPLRFALMEDYFAAQPALSVGGVTWGWLLAALRSMQTTHELHYLSRITIPVLALIGEQDPVTPAAEIAPILNNIPRVRTHMIAQARHDILNETATARKEAWRCIGEFLG